MIISKKQLNNLPNHLQIYFHKKQDNLNGGAYSGGERSDGDWKENSGFKNNKLDEYRQPTGRFPANLIHDNSEEVRECFPNESKRFFKSIIYQAKASKSERNKGCEELEDKFRAGLAGANRDTNEPLDNVSERFRTQPAKNNHPTVKPIALMEYLIKMVTKKGGIVLDPFAGSGSTLVAAKENGFQYIGIEMTEEYIPIIEARLNSVDLTLF